eukprot:SAG11_NODE_558_length_8540_cov_3.877147_10_plen_95_part_00
MPNTLARGAWNSLWKKQVLLLGHDLEVVRHASRTLAELARVCLPVSLEADALTDVVSPAADSASIVLYLRASPAAVLPNLSALTLQRGGHGFAS